MAPSSTHFQVALHEAKHSAFGSSVGFRLTAIHVAASQGYVLWSDDSPVPEDLARLWPQDPEATTILVRHALATLLSPHDGAPFPALCHDSRLVDQFGCAWYRLPAYRGANPAPWPALLCQARIEVRDWYQQSGVVGHLERLVYHLVRPGTLDAQAWTALWQREYAQELRQPTPHAEAARSLRHIPPQATVSHPYGTPSCL